jgi:dynein heavy chain
VLATIKNASKEVNEKLVEAAEKTIEINEKRELFRPVAARGAVLYFCIVEMTQVNWMYDQLMDAHGLLLELEHECEILSDAKNTHIGVGFAFNKE